MILLFGSFMKKISVQYILVLISVFVYSGAAYSADRALELIRKLERNSRGETFTGDLAMTINQRGQSRSVSLRFWSKGRNHALIRILSPARDKGAGNLRVNNDLWQYLPRVNKTIKIPSSLLFQSWMGSDFSNDDLVKSTSLEKDFTHKIITGDLGGQDKSDNKHSGEETLNGKPVVKIECTPKPNAKIVWGKVIVWVSPDEGALYQEDFYTEAGKLVKQLKGYDQKKFGTYTIPTKLTMQDFTKKDSMTEIIYTKVQFDGPVPDSIFTQKELEKIL